LRMKFKKVLLVFPAFDSDTGSSRPSPSIGYLAQTLEDNKIEYDVMDMMLGYSFKELKDKVASFKPDLIGLTLFTLHHRAVYAMLEKLRSTFPDIKIIVGGPHVSIDREKVLKQCAAIDFGCVHEGEKLLVELCHGENPENIPGLIFRDDQRIIAGQPGPFEQNLSELGFPKLKKFELNKYASEVAIVSSRGCPYSCIFCSVSQTLGRKIRTRRADDVVNEIEYWHRKGKRIFNFLDDNFTIYPQRVYEICDEIESRKLKGLVLRCSNGVRADKLDAPLLQKMWSVGFRSIGIGVEAGNNTVLKLLKKGETIEQIDAAVKIACEIGYEVALFFVFGAPGETGEDVEDSINFALKYPVFKVDFYNLIPFPGTELFDWVEHNNAWAADKEELLDATDKNIRFGSRPFFQTFELPLAKRIALNRTLRGVMRKVEKKYITRQLRKKFGILACPLAQAASTRFVQKLYFGNNEFRKLAEKVRYSLME